MISKVDTEFLRAIDPRKSYVPVVRPPVREVTGTASRITEYLPPMNRPELSSLSIEDLRREIERRQKTVAQLQSRREKIATELAALDAEIATYGGSVPAPTNGNASRPRKPARAVAPRAKNSVSLADALAMAVEPRAVVTPAEAAELVTANGYVTTSPRIGMMVANALAKHARFKRVGRGRYERVE